MSEQTKYVPGPLTFDGLWLTSDGIPVAGVYLHSDRCKAALRHAAHATQVLPGMIEALEALTKFLSQTEHLCSTATDLKDLRAIVAGARILIARAKAEQGKAD